MAPLCLRVGGGGGGGFVIQSYINLWFALKSVLRQTGLNLLPKVNLVTFSFVLAFMLIQSPLCYCHSGELGNSVELDARGNNSELSPAIGTTYSFRFGEASSNEQSNKSMLTFQNNCQPVHKQLNPLQKAYTLAKPLNVHNLMLEQPFSKRKHWLNQLPSKQAQRLRLGLNA